MKKTIYLMVLLCSLTVARQSLADVTFSLSPATQTIGTGGSAFLDLNVSGLTNGGLDSLGAFSLDVNYDDGIVSFFDVTFHVSLGDIGNLEADAYFDDSISGTVYLDEVSWLTDSELDAIQTDSFSLATLEFRGINGGVSSTNLANVTASDAFGYELTVSSVQNAEIQVNAVPIPSTILLLGSGLIGILKLRNKTRNT